MIVDMNYFAPAVACVFLVAFNAGELYLSFAVANNRKDHTAYSALVSSCILMGYVTNLLVAIGLLVYLSGKVSA